MKNKILTAIAVMASLCGYAQTKGTSALGFGITTDKSKTDYRDQTGIIRTDERTLNNFTLGYGFFIKDNAKLGIDVNYGNQEYFYEGGVSGWDSKSYGAGVNYQHYYPLIKKLYAFAGGSVGYSYSKTDNKDPNNADRISRSYSAGVNGGVTWFFSRRFAIESNLLSANAFYMTNKEKGIDQSTPGSYENNYTSFNLNSSGVFSNLGFKIYVLF
ncbi:hypothetical protein [Pedobacter nyackensis]|uniref:hypothetical protein n=1 Tax=Pedobacter nyackensis TaxID=475255 RepID=UPI00292F49E0|nr:hypothetical protein [Pedobacter nyackensis]